MAADTKSDRSALLVNETARPALAAWAEALTWKKVEELTLVRRNEEGTEQPETAGDTPP